MQVKYLYINNYQYRIEYIPYNENSLTDNETKSFVMLRNFSFMNNVAIDNNIYFIERDIFDKYKHQLKFNENNILVFPSNQDNMFYSTDYKLFNDELTDQDLYLENKDNENSPLDGLMVYSIYKKHIDGDKYYFTEDKIKCNKVNIYHPQIHNTRNFIIHIENVINNIHFHYYCRTMNSLFTEYQYKNEYDYLQLKDTIKKTYNSNTEYRNNHNIYSEYVTCYIPDINELFDRNYVFNEEIGDYEYDYDWYYQENLNIVETTDNQDFINNIIINIDNQNNRIEDNNSSNIEKQFVPITLFTQPSILIEVDEDENNDGKFSKDEKVFKKVYFKYFESIDYSYNIVPLNISLYPYTHLDNTNHYYVLDPDYLPNTCSFTNPYKFTIYSICDFDLNGKISILTRFHYPNQESYESIFGSTNRALTEAYCFYHHIINRDIFFKDFNTLSEEYKEELDEINKLDHVTDDNIKFLVSSGLAVPNKRKGIGFNSTNYEDYPIDDDYYLNILKKSKFEAFLEEYKDEYQVNIDFFGFKIQIATDTKFKNVILDKEISLIELSNKLDLLNYIDNEAIGFSPFNALQNGLFSFNLTGILTDYAQLPDLLICKITFIDRLIGNNIQSNEVFITKDQFKYIIQVNNVPRLDSVKELNLKYKETILENKNNMIEYNLNKDNSFLDIVNKISNTGNNTAVKEELLDWYENYKSDKFSFVNNVNCIIKKDEVKNTYQTKNNNIQIIYKPIFFKTFELPMLQIRKGKTQNIGIDLTEYISKTTSFILKINNEVYYEIGRNSNYVLFTVNTLNYEEDGGVYEIYDQDSNYITYGNWTLIL